MQGEQKILEKASGCSEGATKNFSVKFSYFLKALWALK